MSYILQTKYRKRVIHKTVLTRLEQIFRDTCFKWESSVVEFNGEEDHVHLLIDYNPKVQISKFVNNLKTVSSRLIRKEFPEQVMIATGSDDRDLGKLRQYLDRVRRYLNVDVVDVFFAEYVTPSDDTHIWAVLDELRAWKERGLVRYVGATTHNRPIALTLIKSGLCEVLMHRYNMAHRKAEEQVFPMALQAEIPVVAFTCTRWVELLQGHPDWQREIPSAADCYRYALHHPAVRLALTAPQTRAQLEENLRVLHAPKLTPEATALWQEYGALIYGNGQDPFETKWL